MANSVCTRTSAQNPTTSTTDTIDPVHLHMQAVNCLSRCKAMLLANEPMYTFALNNLAAAQKAIEALRALDMKMEG